MRSLQTQQLCNHKLTVSVPMAAPAKRLPLKEASRKKRSIFGGSLYERVLVVQKELLNSRKMFDTFADDICDQNLLYDQDYNSTTCWNGMKMDRYVSDIVRSYNDQSLLRHCGLF